VSGFSRTVCALALELVEGETLADRIARGRIPVEEALRIARQITEALEAAHEQGIVHRDLKPGNIKLTRDGVVKVLDFGLAKLTQPDSMSPMSANLTSARAMTGAGVLLGTPAYMSPEQARGEPVDKRTDIWAFGCVLYEMLTGKRAFDGEDVVQTLALILTKETDSAALPHPTPEPVHRLLRRCLDKERKRRLADASDARLEIDEAMNAPPRESASRSAERRTRLAWTVTSILAALLLVATAAVMTEYVRASPPVPSAYRSTLLEPPGVALIPPGGVDRLLALSPDGRRLAFSGVGQDGRRLLWVRSLDGQMAQPLAGTENAQSPFWSPDSNWIGFFAEGQLKKVEAAGGPILVLCRYTGNGGGATWNGEDVIVFSDAVSLYRVSAAGGMATLVMTPDTQAGATNYQWPFFLPDGRHFIYRGAGAQTYLASLESANGTLLGGGFGNAQYAQGHLIWSIDGTLMTQPLDVAGLRLTGEPRPISEQVRTAFSVSQTGVLVYQSAESARSQLVWFDRSGKQLAVLGDHAEYGDVELSPDGAQAAVSVRSGQGTRDIWTVDIARGVRAKFTFDAGNEVGPVWSPDGRTIVFDSIRGGLRNIYQRAHDISTETWLVGGNALSWSPDGRHLLYQNQFRLFALPFVGEREPFQVLGTVSTANLRARFSPDGRWVSYTSTESGRMEVYVIPFLRPGPKTLVSAAGGTWSRWRRDGKELYYQDLNGTLVAAEVALQESTFRIGTVRPLFRTGTSATPDYFGYGYDVTSDGRRFLVNVFSDDPAATPLTLVVNWPTLLRQ
jgi:serine/threonine protein kinase